MRRPYVMSNGKIIRCFQWMFRFVVCSLRFVGCDHGNFSVMVVRIRRFYPLLAKDGCVVKLINFLGGNVRVVVAVDNGCVNKATCINDVVWRVKHVLLAN